MNQGLQVLEAMPVMVLSPEKAAEQREQFAAYVKGQLREDVDFGKVPGTDKPTLLQPGADKLLNLYGLTSRTVVVSQVEDWEKPFFMYRYRADIIWPRPMPDGSIREEVVAQCEGSCNSKEVKYAWRWAKEEELTPELKVMLAGGFLKTKGHEAMLFDWKMTPEQKAKAAAENWRREKKKSAKTGNDYTVVYDPHGVLYRIPNEGVFDQVNTIQKMAQKRARVGATIQAVKASDMFTQDMEDLADNYVPASPAKTEEKTPQNGTEAAKPAPVVVDAEVLDEPKEPHLKPQEAGKEEAVSKDETGIVDLMKTATTSALVGKAWDIALAQQENLGPKAMKRIRDERDANLDRLKGVK